MRKGLAIGTVILLIIALFGMIVIWNVFIKPVHRQGAVTLNETAFRDYCRKIVFKYHCSVCKAKGEMGKDYDRFLELCRWEVGNQSKEQSIDPDKCLEECGCFKNVMEAFNIFKKYDGIECNNPIICDASQAGLYAQMVKLAPKAENGNRVLYLGSDGRIRDCFKIIDPEGGFYIRFKDGSSEDCDNWETGCKLIESSPDSVGQKDIKFVMEAASDEACKDESNKIYLNGLRGYKWECESGCDLLKRDDIPISINFTEINKPGAFGWGTASFKFKVEPCSNIENPIPDVDLKVYALASTGVRKITIKAYPEENTVYDYAFTSPDNYIKINATYRDYLHTSPVKEGKGTVYIDFIVGEEDKDKFDFLNFEIVGEGKNQYLGEKQEGSLYHHIFKCKLLPTQTCSIQIPEKLDVGETATATVKYFAYSVVTTKCIDGVERNYTFPWDNKCKENCYVNPSCEVIGGIRVCYILPEDVVTVENNCEADEFRFTLKKDVAGLSAS